ncbi:hypothetical protein AB0J82_24060 [Asanoa sp. NPDC049518]
MMRSLALGLLPLTALLGALVAVNLWSADPARRRRAKDLLRLLLRR